MEGRRGRGHGVGGGGGSVGESEADPQREVVGAPDPVRGMALGGGGRGREGSTWLNFMFMK